MRWSEALGSPSRRRPLRLRNSFPDPMTTLKARLSSSFGPLWQSVGRGSAALAVATIVGGALVYMATPLVTHVFDPAALGDYGVYLSIVAFLSAVASRKYEETIALPSKDDDAWRLVRSVIANAVRFCLMLTAVLAIAFAARAVGLWHGHLPVVLWVVPVGIFFAVAQAVMLRWVVRHESYSPLVRARIAQGGSMAAGQPALGLATGLTTGAAGAIPLAAGDALSTGIGFYMMTKGPHGARSLRQLIGFERDQVLLRRYRPFMTAGLPASLMNTFTLQIPLLVIAWIYGSADAGQFALAQRLVVTPIAVITSAVTIVLIRQSAIRMKDPASVRQMFSRTSMLLALLGLPLLFLVVVDVGPAGHVAPRSPSGPPPPRCLRPLAFLYFTNLVTTPWSAAVDSAQRQDVFLLRESVRLVLVGGAAVFVAVTEPSAQFAVEIISVPSGRSPTSGTTSSARGRSITLGTSRLWTSPTRVEGSGDGAGRRRRTPQDPPPSAMGPGTPVRGVGRARNVAGLRRPVHRTRSRRHGDLPSPARRDGRPRRGIVRTG